MKLSINPETEDEISCIALRKIEHAATHQPNCKKNQFLCRVTFFFFPTKIWVYING